MNILTFDIEEWFHILDNETTKTEKQWSNYECRLYGNMERIFQILSENKLKATFFCLGWIAEKYPDIIKKIAALGYEVASHSYNHQLIYEMNRNTFRKDLKKSIFHLEDLTGKKVKTYRAPGFSIISSNLWAFEILHELGIENDCSVFPAARAHGGIPDFRYSEPCIIAFNGIEIKEFPMNIVKILGKKIIFSGGGYFRLLPYRFIYRMNKKSDYVMTYFHPRDFDPEQPVIETLSGIRKFKSYVGLKTSENKLQRWIKDFEFTDLKTYNTLIDWTKAKKINLFHAQ